MAICGCLSGKNKGKSSAQVDNKSNSDNQDAVVEAAAEGGQCAAAAAVNNNADAAKVDVVPSKVDVEQSGSSCTSAEKYVSRSEESLESGQHKSSVTFPVPPMGVDNHQPKVSASELLPHNNKNPAQDSGSTQDPPPRDRASFGSSQLSSPAEDASGEMSLDNPPVAPDTPTDKSEKRRHSSLKSRLSRASSIVSSAYSRSSSNVGKPLEIKQRKSFTERMADKIRNSTKFTRRPTIKAAVHGTDVGSILYPFLIHDRTLAAQEKARNTKTRSGSDPDLVNVLPSNVPYELTDYIGGGSRGRVYEAVCTRMSQGARPIAIKVVKGKKHWQMLGVKRSSQTVTPVSPRSPQPREVTFNQDNDLNLLHELVHPRIIHHAEVFSWTCGPDKFFACVTDLYKSSLQNWLNDAVECGHWQFVLGTINHEKWTLRIVTQILSAVEHIHTIARVSHCNIKPSNILFTDSNWTSCKLADCESTFALDILEEEEEEINLDAPDLSPADGLFFSPELLRGNADEFTEKGPDYTPEGDIWAVGICFYLMLFLKPPYDQWELVSQPEFYDVVRNIFKETINDQPDADTAAPSELKWPVFLESSDLLDLISPATVNLLRNMLAPKRHRVTATTALRSPLVARMKMDAGTVQKSRPSGNQANARRASFSNIGSMGPESLIIMSDDGKDLDDELAKVLMATLQRRGLASALLYIANLAPAQMRARLAKGTLAELGMDNVGVCVGSEMLRESGFSPSYYEFDVPYLADEVGVCPVAKTMEAICSELSNSGDNTVSLVLLSGLTDAADLLRTAPDLCKQKIKNVVIMGGVCVDGEKPTLDEKGFMTPDNAQNNMFDLPSAEIVYRDCQTLGIPMTIVSKNAAYACKLPLALYDRMAMTQHAVGVRLRRAQQHSLQGLWRRCHLPEGDTGRQGLPARCDVKWFSTVFLKGRGLDRGPEDDICDLAGTFQAYDPLALMAAVRKLKESFMEPFVQKIPCSTGSAIPHEIIGISPDLHGIKSPDQTKDYLERALMCGLTATDNPTVQMIVMSDDGKDLDDELAKVLMSTLVRRGLAKPLCYVANLAPASKRAQVAKGTLNSMGLGDIQVGIGSDMIQEKKFSAHEFDMPYLANESELIKDYISMCKIHLQTAEPGSITLVLLSGMTDAYILVRDYLQLVKEKVARVVMMGGVAVDGETVIRDNLGHMIPDQAQNNTFDMPAAQGLFKLLQENGIPMTVLTRNAAYAAKLPLNLFDRMAATGHPIGGRMVTAQRFALEDLWKRANMAEDDPARTGLPGRCNKKWFCSVFLNDQGHDLNGEDSIWPLAGHFQAYDPMALLAALPFVRQRYMEPVMVPVRARVKDANRVGKSTWQITYHEIIGISAENHGIQDPDGLRYWLELGLLAGLLSNDEVAAVDVSAPQMTACKRSPSIWSSEQQQHSHAEQSDRGSVRRHRQNRKSKLEAQPEGGGGPSTTQDTIGGHQSIPEDGTSLADGTLADGSQAGDSLRPARILESPPLSPDGRLSMTVEADNDHQHDPPSGSADTPNSPLNNGSWGDSQGRFPSAESAHSGSRGASNFGSGSAGKAILSNSSETSKSVERCMEMSAGLKTGHTPVITPAAQDRISLEVQTEMEDFCRQVVTMRQQFFASSTVTVQSSSKESQTFINAVLGSIRKANTSEFTVDDVQSWQGDGNNEQSTRRTSAGSMNKKLRQQAISVRTSMQHFDFDNAQGFMNNELQPRMNSTTNADLIKKSSDGLLSSIMGDHYRKYRSSRSSASSMANTASNIRSRLKSRGSRGSLADRDDKRGSIASLPEEHVSTPTERSSGYRHSDNILDRQPGKRIP